MIKLPDNKVIITAAVTGAWPLVTKAMNPAVPEQPEEIAETAYACLQEGAAICHMHARDKEGKSTGAWEVYQDIHDRIRARCNIILQDSTGGGPNLSVKERVACVQAKPDMASLNMGSLMRIAGPFKGVPWVNMPEDIEAYVTKMRQAGVKPELEVYGHAMLREVNGLIKKNLIEKPYYINLVMGMTYQGAVEATPKHLYSLIDFLPQDAIFNVSAVGAAQVPLTTMAMILGGCVRVGLEDNLYYRKGELAKSNAQLVARVVRIARELNKEPATPEEARAILGLKAS
jgi:3-keto-5-aminohexanoate cleavage enzyme